MKLHLRFALLLGVRLMVTMTLCVIGLHRLEMELRETHLDAAVEASSRTHVLVRRTVFGVSVLAVLADVGAGLLVLRGVKRSLGRIIELNESVEERVDERTAALDTLNTEMRYVLDAVDQGLVVVDPSGAIAGVRSVRVDEWFDRPPNGTRLCDVFLEVSAGVRANMRSAWLQVADDILPIEVVLDQLPRRVETGLGTYDLTYTPIATDAGQQRILVVISDTTAAAEAERKEREQKDLLGIFVQCLRDQAAVVDFLREADALVATVLSTPDPDLLLLKRSLHTLKGNCGMQEVAGIAAMCHEIESRIADEGRLSPDDAERLRVRWKAFRETTDMVLVGRCGVVVDEREMKETVTAVLTGEPRDAIARRIAAWAHAPTAALLSTLGETAQKLAKKLGKGSLAVRIDHDGSRLERERWAPFWSALIHAVRNAIDHGFERTKERLENGKPPEGLLRLSARHERGELRVEVADDGRGISWERVARELAAQGRPSETREDLQEGLFSDGISTAESVTDISGRGVGMGALREAVRSLGGSIEVDSEVGKGTVVRCRFPTEEKGPARLGAAPPARHAPAVSVRAAPRRRSEAPRRSSTLPPPQPGP